MIFPVLENELTLQVDDRTRLDASKTFLSPDEASITLVEIEPEAGSGFIDVTTNRFLDWQYSTDGLKAVSLRVTTDGSPELILKSINVLTAAQDRLFSTDQDLVVFEPKILDYVRTGRNSFLDVHRVSQEHIVDWLDEHGYRNTDNTRLTKDNIFDIQEVQNWSKFSSLRIIFEGLSNSNDDIFMEKARKYKQMEAESRNRVQISLDTDLDGERNFRAELRTGTLRRG